MMNGDELCASDSYGVLPVVFLNPSVAGISGNGTESQPWKFQYGGDSRSTKTYSSL
ncbi:MAG: hypothetical protein IJ223_02655 [Clostridia bacterium]|nr:hypothetical protein [Clostridia bacterium]